MASEGERLCTVGDVLDAWPPFGKLTETRQAALVDRASAKVLDHCRRPGFLEGHQVEAFDGRNWPWLWLSRRPVISVGSVTINGTALDNTQGDAWYFNAATGELGRGRGRDEVRFAACFPSGRQNIVVEYWGGYSEVPGPVVEAAVLTARWLAELPRISGFYQSERIGDYSYSLAPQVMAMGQDLPAPIAALLTSYVQDDGPL